MKARGKKGGNPRTPILPSKKQTNLPTREEIFSDDFWFIQALVGAVSDSRAVWDPTFLINFYKNH